MTCPGIKENVDMFRSNESVPMGLGSLGASTHHETKRAGRKILLALCFFSTGNEPINEPTFNVWMSILI
jgi:hypothetical protein